MIDHSSMFIMKALLLIFSLVIAAPNAEKLMSRYHPRLIRMEVDITNNLEHPQDMVVHCKDANEDFGLHLVPYGQLYKLKFQFQQGGEGDDYYCGFIFNGKLHWFDVYKTLRDYSYCGVVGFCAWSINENGPCKDDDRVPKYCYPWNHNDSRPLA